MFHVYCVVNEWRYTCQRDLLCSNRLASSKMIVWSVKRQWINTIVSSERRGKKSAITFRFIRHSLLCRRCMTCCVIASFRNSMSPLVFVDLHERRAPSQRNEIKRDERTVSKSCRYCRSCLVKIFVRTCVFSFSSFHVRCRKIFKKTEEKFITNTQKTNKKLVVNTFFFLLFSSLFTRKLY